MANHLQSSEASSVAYKCTCDISVFGWKISKMKFSVKILTFEALIMTAADNSLEYFFRENKTCYFM